MTAFPLLFLLAPALLAPQETFRGGEILDPATNTWRPVIQDPTTAPLETAAKHLAAGEHNAARRILADWLDNHPDHPAFYEAVLLYGDAFFQAERFWKASEQYEIVAANTVGETFDNALRRQMDVARAFLEGKRRIVLGFIPITAYDEGVELLDRIYERVPGSRLGEQALKLKADYFFNAAQYESALAEYAFLAQEFPNSRYTRTALLRAATSAQAMFPGVRHDDQALIEAAERYNQLQEAFPEFAAEMNVAARLDEIRAQQAEKDFAVADYYLRAGYRPAGVYYLQQVRQDWPGTRAAQQAAERLTDLGVAPAPAEE